MKHAPKRSPTPPRLVELEKLAAVQAGSDSMSIEDKVMLMLMMVSRR